MYASVAATNGSKVHSLKVGMSKPIPPSPRDYRYAGKTESYYNNKEGEGEGEGVSSGKIKAFRCLLICCCVLTLLVVAGIAIAALVLALKGGAGGGGCECKDDINRLLIQTEAQRRRIEQLEEMLDANQDNVGALRGEVTSYEQRLDSAEAGVSTVNSTFIQRVNLLEAKVALLDAKVRDDEGRIPEQCSTSQEADCQLQPEFTRSGLNCRTFPPVVEDETVLEYSCDSTNSNVITRVVSDNDAGVSCDCSLEDFGEVISEGLCIMTVTRCNFK